MEEQSHPIDPTSSSGASSFGAASSGAPRAGQDRQVLEPEVLEALLGQLDASDEKVRVQALLTLQGHGGAYPEALVRRLDQLSGDPSRIVREQARVLAAGVRSPRSVALSALGAAHLPENASPANGVLALLSFGSATSGLLLTVMSLIQYYALGGFPFPSPLEVLFWLNLGLTLPFVLLGVVLLLPGRGQKRLAVSGAWVSVLVWLGVALGARNVFERLWLEHFTPAMQLKYLAFLSPGTLLVALAPLLAGQLLLAYLGGQVLVREAQAETQQG